MTEKAEKTNASTSYPAAQLKSINIMEILRNLATTLSARFRDLPGASIRLEKPYRYLMAEWTEDVLNWAGDTQVLLGIPVYDDQDVGYHHPEVENLENALAGVHAGLSKWRERPANYEGVAIYSEWEMDEQEWSSLSKEFLVPHD